MKILMTITVLASTLLWNVSYASSEQELTCKTGFFSSKVFIVKTDSLLKNDETCDLDADYWVYECTQDPIDLTRYNYYASHLLSDSRKSLNTSSNYYPSSDHNQSFKWQEGDLEYRLWDSPKGWAINIIEKDWSSSEGNHYDTVLDNTYCRESD